MASSPLIDPLLAIMAIILIVLILIGARKPHKDSFTQSETFNAPPKSGYDKELHLFKSFNSSEQQEYLNLSREDKMIKYGTLLR
jgi:hypothetical protein